MTDVHDRETRSYNMSRIRGKDTKLECRIRKPLWHRGFRYRLHKKGLPGKPDLVFDRYRAIVLANGCFWHFHGCHMSKLPDSPFWRNKIKGTAERDRRNIRKYHELGYRVLTVWECALRGKTRRPEEEVIDAIVVWLAEGEGDLEIAG